MRSDDGYYGDSSILQIRHVGHLFPPTDLPPVVLRTSLPLSGKILSDSLLCSNFHTSATLKVTSGSFQASTQSLCPTGKQTTSSSRDTSAVASSIS